MLFAGCKRENALDCFKSNGPEVTEARDVGTFSIIKLYSKIDLNITKGTGFKVEVTAGKHIIKNIKTTIADDILTIENDNKCNFVRGYKKNITVNITLPYILKVENRGVGTIRFDGNYTQDTLQVRAENSGDIYVNGTYTEIRTSSHGNGDIYLQGSCNNLYAYTYGTNVLKAEELTINNYVFIETISIGDCFVKAPNGGKLEYNIWRDGNIYYLGNPSVINNFKGDGKGKLIKED